MASITIRKLDDALKGKLRVRAAQHGRSMEDEARQILRTALADETGGATDLYDAIRRRLAPLGGVDLVIPARGPMREPPRFDE
jgi:plasmid stability protein